MSDKNILGGGNAKSLYMPMSELEQEAILRLVEARDFRIHVVGWAVIQNMRVTFGDLRLSFAFRLNFDRPEFPLDLPYLDLELRTGSGQLLFSERQPTTYDGQPVKVAQGVFFDLVWDIAIKAIDPNLVKQLLPGAVGLTSRRTDRDTGDLTLTGNMQTTVEQRNALRKLQQGEQVSHAWTAERLRKIV